MPLTCGPPILMVTSRPACLYRPVATAWEKPPCAAWAYQLVRKVSFSWAWVGAIRPRVRVSPKARVRSRRERAWTGAMRGGVTVADMRGPLAGWGRSGGMRGSAVVQLVGRCLGWLCLTPDNRRVHRSRRREQFPVGVARVGRAPD